MKIGVYAGSFNPFHRGHFNILEKAEKIFDMVIIARGVNLEKKNDVKPMPKVLENKTIMNYNGLLTDFLISLEYDNVTLIRGLRNSVDLQHEMNQYRYFQDLMPNIQMVSIFCDKEFEHISSSGIRLLSNYGEDKIKKYLI